MKMNFLYKTLSICIRRYRWIHLTIGIIGNLLFLSGAVLFLRESDIAGWFFITGSLGMLLNALGDLIAETESCGKTALTEIGDDARRKYLQKFQQEYCDLGKK